MIKYKIIIGYNMVRYTRLWYNMYSPLKVIFVDILLYAENNSRSPSASTGCSWTKLTGTSTAWDERRAAWWEKNMATVVGISWECLGNLWNIISTVVEYHGIFWNMFDNTMFVLNMMEYGYGLEMEVYSGKKMYRMYINTILPNME